MSIKEVCRAIMSHVIFFALGTIFFVFLFHTNLFKEINVFFYRGIILLITSCIFVLLIEVLYERTFYGKIFTHKDIILSVVLVFCINLVLFTHLPVTADRSISVFILGYMDKYPDKIFTKDMFAKVITGKYLYEYGAIDKRLSEQIISGNISRDGSTYTITEQGKFLIKLYGIIVDMFNISKKLISP
jgi:hypothetical protein